LATVPAEEILLTRFRQARFVFQNSTSNVIAYLLLVNVFFIFFPWKLSATSKARQESMLKKNCLLK
jgi:hypothetical protein